jgi:predicted small secreted protein
MRKNIATAIVSLCALTAVAAGLSACNTARGMGQDVSAAGHAVTGTAERAQGR